jgi:hypothetical protein
MSVVVHLSEELSRRVEAAAVARGISPEQVAVEAIESQLSAGDGLEGFIGSGDSGDPWWASRDIHELRADLAARRLGEGT